MTTVEVIQRIEVDPKLLASVFWEFDGEAQREFFEELGRISDEESLSGQMEFVRARNISKSGLRTMEIIGGNK